MTPSPRANPAKLPKSDKKPTRKWRVGWREGLPCSTGIYMYRWFLETPWFSVRLHHWLKGDDERARHDHGWSFLTFILKGGYTDVTDHGEEIMRAGHFSFRGANHAHTVRVAPGEEAWTLVLTGPLMRYFGFIKDGKWIKANKWFKTMGAHPCA